MDISSVGNTPPPPLQTHPAPTGTSPSTTAGTARPADPAAATGAAQAAAGKRPEPLSAIQQPQEGEGTGRQGLQQALEEVRNALNPVARDLQFSIDDDTGRTVVKIVDTATDEVIKQIPSEELLKIAKALDKLQGLLVQQSV